MSEFSHNIYALEDAIVNELPLLDLDVRHHFAGGLYARELFIPAGTILTGKIHKYDCINVVPVGKIQVATEEGSKLIEGPYVFVSPPGTKRAGVTLEDTIWITVHASNETDLDALEKQLIAESFDRLPNHRKMVLEDL